MDIQSLDVKMAPNKNKMAAALQQRGKSTEDEVDFFADMTPDIPTNGLDLEKIQQQINNKKVKNKYINFQKVLQVSRSLKNSRYQNIINRSTP